MSDVVCDLPPKGAKATLGSGDGNLSSSPWSPSPATKEIRELSLLCRRRLFRPSLDMTRLEINYYAAMILLFLGCIGVPSFLKSIISSALSASDNAEFLSRSIFILACLAVSYNIADCMIRYYRSPLALQESGKLSFLRKSGQAQTPTPPQKKQKILPKFPEFITSDPYPGLESTRRMDTSPATALRTGIFSGPYRQGLDSIILNELVGRHDMGASSVILNTDNDILQPQSPSALPRQVSYEHPLPKFRNSTRPVSTAAKISRTEDGVIIKDHQITIDEWNVALHLEDWIIAIRKWLCQKVVKYVLSLVNSYESKAPASPPSAWDAAPNVSNLYHHRLCIDRYICIPGYDSKSYVSGRIKDLAATGNMACFSWNSGATCDGIRWSPVKYPSDSELVYHLFCTFLDENLSSADLFLSGASPFGTRYSVPLDSKSYPLRSIQIKRTSRFPPHFDIISNGIVYQIPPGRNNLFATLSMFTYYIKSQLSCYIDTLNVGGPSIGLTDAILTTPVIGKFGSQLTSGPRESRSSP